MAERKKKGKKGDEEPEKGTPAPPPEQRPEADHTTPGAGDPEQEAEDRSLDEATEGRPSPKEEVDEIVDAYGIQPEEAVLFSASFSGPVPPPGILAAYEALVPGFASMLAAGFDESRVHTRQIETREADRRDLQVAEWAKDAQSLREDRVAGREETKLRLWLGFWSTALLFAGVVTISIAVPAAAPVAVVSLGIVGAAGIVKAFLGGKPAEEASDSE